jgi:hypothetical protein
MHSFIVFTAFCLAVAGRGESQPTLPHLFFVSDLALSHGSDAHVWAYAC